MNKTTLLGSNDLLDVFSASQSATAIYTTEALHIEAVTDGMLEMWDKDRSIIGLSLPEAIPELSGQRFFDELRSVLLTGVTIKGTSVPAELLRNGKLHTGYYDYEYKAVKNRDGNIFCVLHTATEVTDRVLGMEAVKSLENEQALNEELAAANEELTATNEELDESRRNLDLLNEVLERRIVERTQLAEAARYRLEAMVMNTPIAMTILKGYDLVVEVVNQPMLSVWRRKQEDVIGRGLVEIFPELINQPNPGRMRGVMQTGKRFTLPETEVILGTVDGELKKHYANFSYDPIFEPDGTVDSILVTVINITEEVLYRQQLEQSREELEASNEELIAITEDLEESNRRLNMAMEASSLGITEVVFATGKMIASEQFKKNFGRTAEDEFTYMQLFESMLPKYREDVKQRVKAAIDNHTVYEAEYEIEWPDGSHHWISAHGIPRYDNDIATRIVGVAALITEQKNIERQKDDFLSVASHELKTPITSLKGTLQLLQRLRENLSNPIVPKLIDNANKSMDRITVLVDDLLNVNRFSQSKLPLKHDRFNVAKMLQNSCAVLLTENKYEVIIESDPELVMMADEHRIEQVVINFINNAVKYAPDSKRINLRAGKSGQEIKISVQDYGPGIPEDQLPHLFDRYWRADHTGKKYSGLGLGLFICAEIVERHGGKIGAESIQGGGTTFWFTMPLTAV